MKKRPQVKRKKWTGCYDDQWKGFITDASFAHPAKFSKALIERILDYLAEKKWTQPGDIVGDPFGGVATGGLIAAYRGYRWIGVELEPKFVQLGQGNIERHNTKFKALGVPAPTLIQGDSREFNVAVAIVSSPPYAGSLDDGGPEKAHPDGYKRTNNWTGYGSSKQERADGNIEELTEGNVSAIVSSPPYEQIHAGAGGLNHLPAREGQQGGRKKGASQEEGMNHSQERYGDSPGQIARAAKGPVDAIVSSPPWMKNVEGSRKASKFKGRDAVLKCKRGNGASNEAVLAQAARDEEKTLGDSIGQIGREAGETYWQAVARVYRACYLSLKPGGIIALVVKDFVKDQKRMHLCDDTMRLLVWLGFEEVERIHAMLTEERIHDDLFEGTTSTKVERKSFFRRLHESKLAPDDPRRINFEEVLICRKPTS